MASYVEQIPIAGFDCIVYSGYRYATIDMLGMLKGNKRGYEELTPFTALTQWRMLPRGWELVPNTEEVKTNVIGGHDWGCSYVTLGDGTTVQTGSQEGERTEWKFTLEKHRTKEAYRMRDDVFKPRILMRKSMTISASCSAVPAKRQKLMLMENVWGDSPHPAAWVNDPVFRKLDELWKEADTASNGYVLDDICLAADKLDVGGDLRDFRRNLFAKIEKKTLQSGAHKGKKEEDSCDSNESSDSDSSSSSCKTAQ